MTEARDIERAGLVVLEAAREARSAATELKEAAASFDWAVARLREERMECERVIAEMAAAVQVSVPPASPARTHEVD